MNRKIGVLVVDDSSFIRNIFTAILSADADIQVLGTAGDPLIARDMMKRLKPDVVTLDIEMPNMDGLMFLEKIMTLRPTPVVMVSSLTQHNAEATLRALEIGAVDCIGKPTESSDIKSIEVELIAKVKAAAKAKLRTKPIPKQKVCPIPTGGTSSGLIAIGASTGGVEALRAIVPFFPPNSPPIVITQHMPPGFTSQLARRLSSVSSIDVQEAAHGMKVSSGNAYIAPGGSHLEVEGRAGAYTCRVHQGKKISGHRPSVDVMFASVARTVGKAAVGVILTGMGKDGAAGMLSMKQAGSYTIAQDEDSSVVYGMPKAAYLAGAVDVQLGLEFITEAVCSHFSTVRQASHRRGNEI
ncbi:MAG: chemotaxis response regulator protein-glutamate methylesterase [Proteobacteria bacterium]|nr:chemotaxis response regulator protein-glutamate methylesterase [Pseudomonadota bacterium]